MADLPVRNASIRTLAWLGDVEFERIVRWALARRGDHPVTRLDTARAKIVRAEGQARLLEVIRPQLTEHEQAVVRRATNAAVGGRGRAMRDTRAYRAATGFEALLGWWACGESEARERMHALLMPPLADAVDDALATSAPPIRG